MKDLLLIKVPEKELINADPPKIVDLFKELYPNANVVVVPNNIEVLINEEAWGSLIGIRNMINKIIEGGGHGEEKP